ncbi:MAG: pyruvate dehydrogenase complex dihydrolipoamide acetyltransferase [Bacteroidia bacterium]|nr:pyruvate dehydrogenase complex dihydrolipoamide acetyltransferase [Bacteroidia bacterium]MCX7651570.1 pyruvate dehydrogenase complex dihydrolipoamide acetyltransferase [Bacteroidia bacterium]MDW8417254.1 pyruvate dehydrogenase complex dihydrolipoamide acetyltransferase [Bacteroidia bacterium]
MAEVVEMPRLSDTMTEGVIARWLKKVGDPVKPGDLLAEIETDKATMEFESPVGGILLHIGAEEGKPIPIGAVIAIIGKAGEDISALLSSSKVSTSATTSETAVPTETVSGSTGSIAPSTSAAPSSLSEGEGRLKASPLARAIAREKGIDLREITGTGEGGRIIRRDVEAHLAQHIQKPSVPTTALPTSAAYSDQPLTQMRKTIARRLTASMQEAPHFYLTISVSMEKVSQWRAHLNQLSDVKISFNDFILKACASALRKHPLLNASWTGESIRLYHEIHIGFAVAVEEGLIVPVLRHADRKGLAEIAKETQTLAEKARQRKLSPEEYTGSTFSVSNLGMFGIEEFTAVINPPEAAILAVGAIQAVPVVRPNDEIAVERRMRLTLSCDHRVVDGATGAQFLQTLKQLLEEPERLLL